MESKIKLNSETGEKWLPGPGERGYSKRMAKGYKFSVMSKIWGSNVEHDTLADNIVLYNLNVLRVELKCSHKRERVKWVNVKNNKTILYDTIVVNTIH